MPKTTVSACKIELNGKTAYRVCIPAAAQEHFQAKRRFFNTKAEADAFARDVNEARGGWVTRILALPENIQGRLLRCYELAGSNIELLERQAGQAAKLTAAQEKLFAEAVDQYAAEKTEAGKSDGYLYGITFTFKGLRAKHAGRKVSELTRDDIKAHMNGNGWSGTTRQNVLRYCKGFFKWAISAGYAAENPCDGIEKPKADKRPIRVLTIDEAAALLKTAYEIDRPMVSYIALGLFMGGRKSELRRLGAEDVRDYCVEVGAHKSKTGQRRAVTPPPVLLEWLKISSDLKWSNWQRRFEAIRKAAGITTWGNGPLRHTFSSYAIMKFGPGEAAYMGGHSQHVLKTNYMAKVNPLDVPRYWALTPDVVLGTPKPEAPAVAANVLPMQEAA